MPRNMYCSYCGMELRHSPKALKNKQMVIHTVDPHECDEQFADNITDAEKPQTPFARELSDREKRVSASEQQAREDNLLSGTPDRRKPDHLRKPLTSSAPTGVLHTVKSSMPESTPAREMIDLDGGKEGDDSEA